MLEALRFIDQVISLTEMKTDDDYRKLVKRVRPEVIAVTKGDSLLAKKKSHAIAVGARVVEIPKLRINSTSDILRGNSF